MFALLLTEVVRLICETIALVERPLLAFAPSSYAWKGTLTGTWFSLIGDSMVFSLCFF